LLEAGHRAADAIIRFSDLRKSFEDAFRAIKDRGDAEPLAKLGPTSLVFGAWDSRATQVKLPRVVRSVIRAYHVQPLHRSAQYIPAYDYVEEGVLDAAQGKTEQDSMSQLGFQHAPAPWTHGGVQAREIRREATLNLAALRTFNALAKNSLPLRRYILSLALVAFTAPQDTSLREGCQLVPDPGRPSEWKMVKHNGQRETLSVSHEEAMLYAIEVSQIFKVGPDCEGSFDAKSARAELAQSKEERKKSRRNDKNTESDGQ
jgi:CRISPR-associated protein Csb1